MKNFKDFEEKKLEILSEKTTKSSLIDTELFKKYEDRRNFKQGRGGHCAQEGADGKNEVRSKAPNLFWN